VSAINIQSMRDESHHHDWARPVLDADAQGGAMAFFCECAIEPGPGGDIMVLRVAGEIDMLTIPVLQDALGAAVSRHPADLVVDLAGVDFCCVRGFALLAAADRTAQTCGTGYALSGLTLHLNRLATLLDREQRCVRYRSVAAAVSAIRVDHTHRPA
jgi:anti-anti-sigma factor